MIMFTEGMRAKGQETDMKLAQQRNAFADRESALEDQVKSKADVVFQYMQKYEEVESRCEALFRDCDTLRSKLRDQSRDYDLVCACGVAFYYCSLCILDVAINLRKLSQREIAVSDKKYCKS